MTVAEQKARYLLTLRTTEQLIGDFEATETVNDSAIYMVRGWLMDELESRNAQAFEAWIDSDEVSPRKFYM